MLDERKQQVLRPLTSATFVNRITRDPIFLMTQCTFKSDCHTSVWPLARALPPDSAVRLSESM